MSNLDIKFKRLTPFKRCVLQNFPFIEADFDALTNYGLLCKIVEYLNQVIASQNEVQGVTEEIVTAFNNLYDYVHDYFENLDVQEEINNKLDQMVEDGTLQEIIGDYLNATAVWGFDTVADMTASTNLIDGSFARTLGYYSVNDGGGAVYHIRTLEVGDTIDNGFIVQMSDETLVAELVYENEINILQLGAKKDESEEITSILQNSINKAGEGDRPLIVKIPSGEYLCGSVEVGKNSHIIGAGRGNTIIKAKDNLSFPLISIIDADAYYIKLQDFTIFGNRDNNTMPYAIYIARSTATQDPINTPAGATDMWLEISNLRIANCYGHGIGNPESGNINFREVRFNNIEVNNCLGNGFYLRGSDNHYSQLTAWACRLNGFYIRGSADTFVDCKAFACGSNNDGSGWDIQESGLSLIECWAQENAGHGFNIANSTNCTLILHAGTNGKASVDDSSKHFAGINIVPDTVVQRMNIIANCSNGTNSVYCQDYGISCGDMQGSTVILTSIDQNTSNINTPKSYVLTTGKNDISVNSARLSTKYSADVLMSKDTAKLSWAKADSTQNSRWELYQSGSGNLRLDHIYNNQYKSRPLLISYDSDSNLSSIVLGTTTGKLGFFGKDDAQAKKTIVNPVATDTASAVALLNEVVSDLISYGLLTR